jgi:hypothetical protein
MMELFRYDGKQWRLHFEEFTKQLAGTPAVQCSSR